jgi:hypothetical protein
MASVVLSKGKWIMAKSVAELQVSLGKLKEMVLVVQRSVAARVARPPADLTDHVTAVEQATAALLDAATALDKTA